MPASLVVVWRVVPVPCCVILTVAFFTTAPVVSRTVPVSVPRLVWANAVENSASSSSNPLKKGRFMFINIPQVLVGESGGCHRVLLHLNEPCYSKVLMIPTAPRRSAPTTSVGELYSQN